MGPTLKPPSPTYILLGGAEEFRTIRIGYMYTDRFGLAGASGCVHESAVVAHTRWSCSHRCRDNFGPVAVLLISIPYGGIV